MEKRHTTETQEGRNQEAKEEGEIKDAGEREVKSMEVDLMDQPSLKFQVELANTIAPGAEMVSHPTDGEQGLDEGQMLLEEKMASPEDEEHLMGMDEIKAHLLEHGIDMDAAEDLPDFSDVETEEALMAYDEEVQPQEEEVQPLSGDGDGDDAAAEDLGENKTSHKRLFKPAANTAVSTKMRNASALVSPHKRVAPKAGNRRGETNEQ
ncbi:hypothetical protein F2Q70_00026420 [Brassica cretica]|uniref:Uncharacterized protein n=1 Tax=Brassica cretica TaxID=69181 RepID=A0A8S9LCM2_BRACR|nr:hypothetical protein F2Q70_00026420 [Brassica cretica]